VVDGPAELLATVPARRVPALEVEERLLADLQGREAGVERGARGRLGDRDEADRVSPPALREREISKQPRHVFVGTERVRPTDGSPARLEVADASSAGTMEEPRRVVAREKRERAPAVAVERRLELRHRRGVVETSRRSASSR